MSEDIPLPALSLYDSSSADSEGGPRVNYKQTQLFPDGEFDDSAICELLLEMSDVIEDKIDLSVCFNLGH